jgi:hypothetical protein
MKFKILIILHIITILLSIITNSYTKFSKKLNKKKTSQIKIISPSNPLMQPLPENRMMHFFATNAKNYVPFARLAYCQRPVIEQFSCSFCSKFQTGHYNPYFIHSIIQNPNRVFQLLILYSDIKKEIVISFSGPSSEHGNFFTNIFLEGFVIVPEIGNLKVEKVYWETYSLNFRALLAQKIQKFLSFGRAEYKFIFVGHSFGGSIATLASYDLIFNHVIPKNPAINSPQIFTYGQLRIGDNAYVNRLNSELKIVRILKKDDFIARMPNCVFISGEYKCFDTTQALVNVMPRMRTYIDACGNPKSFFAFIETRSKKIKKFAKKNKKNYDKNNGLGSVKDPIVRGTSMINGNLVATHRPIFYTQPLGTELLYSQAFNKAEKCAYVNGIPVCEKSIQLPRTFTPEVHRNYYNMNIELC